ncbi:retrovirus-related Pol polyprotein from transposon 17.6 [Clarias gariepinus]
MTWQVVLQLAHEHPLSGHLGVNKTYKRISRYFFWPGLKSSVSNFCRSCHVCQLAEAVPLRTLKAHAIVKEVVRFCSTFGLPRVVQTDQGTNFTSKVFAQILKELGVAHKMSSAYHPESQGALERFHQTLKSMLRAYCLSTGKDWVEGLPMLMFAVRETVQESLGFSPAELVFGHTVRGPLKLLSEQWLLKDPVSSNILDYVSAFRERLHKACEIAKSHLATVQSKMKLRHDKTCVKRSFQPGELVLVLLPVPGSALQAKFQGPYAVEKKLTDTDYVIVTPDRKKKSRVCHLNMLKAYVKSDAAKETPVCDSVSAVTVLSSACCPQEDNLVGNEERMSCISLNNSAVLSDLDSYLAHLPENQRADIVQLIRKYDHLFSDVPRQTTILTHDIDVGDSPPIKQHPYRVNPHKREIMKSEIEYLLQHGFATPSQSPWSSPCLLVPKSNLSYRFCTDYRKVNSVTKPDSFPLPRVEDCVDRVGSARYVTKLDLLKGYWQVPLTPRASEISAFVTPDNFLQYSVMAFGMRNAPATFQRLMHRVLLGMTNCEAYLDDVVIYSDSWESHLSSLNQVFNRLSDASLTLNLMKCEFAKAVVTYLGKRVGQGSVRPVEEKVVAILNFPSPTNKRELRRFLGMTGYYRGFCKNFATVVAPLTDLLSTSKKFGWSQDCNYAFNAAKDLLCHAPVLSAPNFSLPFKLQVDASSSGAGAVLLQEDVTGVEHPVSYFSKKFTRCQMKYSTIEKEALALLLALQHFEVYLGGSSNPVVVYTDHNPLIFLGRMQNSNQRLMRWSLIIQEYNLDIQHRRGVENVVADALSRVYSRDN